MWWFVLLIAMAWAVVCASVIATTASIILSWIPNAGVRKWFVILTGLLSLFVVGLFAIAVYFDPGIIEDLLDPIGDRLERLPRVTVLLCVPAIIFALSLLWFVVRGMRPQSGVPYQPRAASWCLRRQIRMLFLLGVAVVVVILLQDFELRWRLGNMEAAALATADELIPAHVARDHNAAIYYQQIIDIKNAQWDKDDPEQRENPLQGLSSCECESEARQEYFEGLAPIREKFLAAADCNSCRFDDNYAPVDLLDSMDATFALVGAAQNMILYARYLVCQQKPKEAIIIIKALRQLEHHLQADSRGSDSVFYFWIEGWIQGTIEQMGAYCHTIPVEAAKELIAEPLDVVEYHHRILAWRSAVIRMHIVKTLDGRNYLRPEMHNEFFDSPVRRAIGCQGMRLYYARDEMAAIEASFPFLTNPSDPDSWEERGYGEAFPTGDILRSTWSSSAGIGWLLRGQSTQQLSNIALAATLFHQERGKWPESTTELVPSYLSKSPVDQSTDEPFLWLQIDGGAIVYAGSEREFFDKFDDSNDWWWEAGDRSMDAIFLGEAYRRRQRAALPDPENPCAPTL